VSGCPPDAAPYLLGALEPGEARAFVRHLEGCAVCRDEVASLAPVIDALPASATPLRVRAAFRRRMLRAVRAEPKLSRGRIPTSVSRARAAPAGWLALGLAVAAAAIVVAVGIPHTRARMIQASVGLATLRVSGGHGELIVEHLPALPANRTYELWLEPRGEALRPSTLFAVDAQGRADLSVPGDLGDIGRLLVTVEPRGGSLAPTTPAVVVERLT